MDLTQILLDSYDYPIRVNISYRLEDAALAFARAANLEISRAGGEFLFAPSGSATPHITLLMGEVGSSADLVSLARELRRITFGFKPIQFSFSPPYFRDERKRYIFVDANPQRAFFEQRLELQSSIRTDFKLDYFGDASNVSHVTLGYLAEGGSNELLTKLTRGVEVVSSQASVIQLADTGRRGTVRRVLMSIDLA